MDDNEKYREVMDMLTVLYKRLSELEKEVRGGLRMASARAYLDELRREASKLKD
jgi:hypothetical protein